MTFKEKQFNQIKPSKDRIVMLLEIIKEEINKSSLNQKVFGEIEGDIESTIDSLNELTYEQFCELYHGN